jgi:hypothetical protein
MYSKPHAGNVLSGWYVDGDRLMEIIRKELFEMENDIA